MAELAVAWLLTFLLHSTLLVLAALAVERLVAGRAPRVVDLGFKLALTGGLLTATLALALPGTTRLRFDLGADAARSAEPAASAAIALPAAESESVGRGTVGRGTRFVAEAGRSGSLPADAPAPAASLAPAVDWRVVAVGLWLLGVGVALVAPARAAHRLQRLLAGRRGIAGPLAARLAADAARAGLQAPVALSTSAQLPVPIAQGWRRPEVVLPATLVRELPAGELAAVLAHELAHLVRRDPAWLHLGALLRALLWPQPLLALALRRWRENAELVCDDWAVACLGQRAVLARCLARVAGALSRPAAPLLAPGMAGEGARVVGRVRRLLSPPAAAPMHRLGYVRVGAVALTLLLTALGPAVLPATGRMAGDPAAEAEATSTPRAQDQPPAAGSPRWRVPPRPPRPVPPVVAVAPVAPAAPVPPAVVWIAPAAPPAPPALPVPAAPPAPALPSAPALAPVPPAPAVPPVPPVPPVARSGGGRCWYVPDDGEPFAVDCDDLEASEHGAPWAAARELAAQARALAAEAREREREVVRELGELPGRAEEARRIAAGVEAELAARVAEEQARLHQQHDLLRRDRERVARELARLERDRARGARVLVVPDRRDDHLEAEVAASLETALSALEDALETLPTDAGSELERELERELARLAEQLEASAERLAAARDRRGRVP